MFTFAYGSNMDSEQMTDRCPSERKVCIAKMGGHRLAFTRTSKKWNGGVADVLPSAGDEVWGVVYELSAGDLRRLDEYEGYKEGRPESKNAYNRQERVVLREGDTANALTAWVYLATPQPGTHRPSLEYLRHIIKGAKENELPAPYLSKLEHLEKVE